MPRTALALSILLITSVTTSAFAQPRPPTIDDVVRRLGLSEAAAARAKNGEVVAEDLESTSDKDLALAVVVRINAPPKTVYEFVKADKLAKFQTVTIAVGPIDPSNPSLAGMTLSDDTLKKLAQDPGGTFYMSDEEATRVAEAGKLGTTKAFAAYQDVLVARAKAYWEQGLNGITAYAGKGRSPAVDLAHANEAGKALLRSPETWAELDTVPAKHSGKATHQLFWAVQKSRDQAAPVLIHRVLFRTPGAEIFLERRFYSAYDYDALQILTGVLPTSSGDSAVFYTNHTYTAQVTGFGGSAKRSIGRKLLAKDLVAEMQRAQHVARAGG